MILQAYSVYDKLAKVFARPVYFTNDDVATRAVIDAIKTGEPEFAKHPEDYVFFRIGEFNDSNGYLETPDEGPEKIVTFFELEQLSRQETIPE